MRTIEHDMLLPLAAMAGIPSNVLDQSGMRIARCDYDGEMCPEGDANAAYIIKCVNSYAALQAENVKLQAALRASTALLYARRSGKYDATLENQIAANEAVLGSEK